MRQKAAKQLSKLNDQDLFKFIADGIPQIYQNALHIEDGVQSLVKTGNVRGARILRVVSEEEAAKCLILLDAVRCPRNFSDRFSQQLGRFADHVAKGIYARSCYWQSGNLGVVMPLIEFLRQAQHLDGPNNNDWIFPNEVKSDRENALYVDCVKDDDGNLCWFNPFRIDDCFAKMFPQAQALFLLHALIEAGFCSSEALEIIAKRWRKICPDDNYHRSRLEAEIGNAALDLEEAKLLNQDAESWLHVIRQYWFFPLWNVDLKEIPVDEKKLREEQEN